MCDIFMHGIALVHIVACRYSNLKINMKKCCISCSLRVYLQVCLLVNMPTIYSKLQSIIETVLVVLIRAVG